jgi:hypothetical protein
MPLDLGEEFVVIARTTQDRAAVVTTAIIQIVATVQEPERRRVLEDYLREEFAEVQRQAFADPEPVADIPHELPE